jgi:uncharacterized membrane protein YphA (DoxX/SURF4 family)
MTGEHLIQKAECDVEEVLKFAWHIANRGDAGTEEPEPIGSCGVLPAKDHSDVDPHEVRFGVEEVARSSERQANGNGPPGRETELRDSADQANGDDVKAEAVPRSFELIAEDESCASDEAGFAVEQSVQFTGDQADGGSTPSVDADPVKPCPEWPVEEDTAAIPVEVGWSVEELPQFSDLEADGGGSRDVEAQVDSRVLPEHDAGADLQTLERCVEELLQFAGPPPNGIELPNLEAETIRPGLELIAECNGHADVGGAELSNLANGRVNGSGSPGVHLESAPAIPAGRSDGHSRNVERSVEELLHSLAGSQADDARQSDTRAKKVGSARQSLGASDANPRMHMSSHRPEKNAAAGSSASSHSADSSKPESGITGAIFAFGRVAIVIPFLMAAALRLVNADASAGIITSKLLALAETPLPHALTAFEATFGLPFAAFLVIAGATVELAAAAWIAIGMLIRPASMILAIFAGLELCWLNWDFQNGVQPDQVIPALQWLAIIAALFVLSGLPWFAARRAPRLKPTGCGTRPGADIRRRDSRSHDPSPSRSERRSPSPRWAAPSAGNAFRFAPAID